MRDFDSKRWNRAVSCSLLLAFRSARQIIKHLTYKEIDEEQLCPYLTPYTSVGRRRKMNEEGKRDDPRLEQNKLSIRVSSTTYHMKFCVITC